MKHVVPGKPIRLSGVVEKIEWVVISLGHFAIVPAEEIFGIHIH